MKTGKRLMSFALTLILVLVTVILPSFSVSAATLKEKESNNSSKYANELKSGQKIEGHLKSRQDVDVYKIKTSAKGDITFNFTHDADGVYSYYWYAKLTNKDGKVLKEGTLSGKDPTDFALEGVKKGTYYLSISAISGGNPLINGFTTAEYRLKVKFKCANHGELTKWKKTVAPTCTKEGERSKKCSDCGEVVVTEAVEKLGHKYNEWSVVEKAGFFSIGEKKHTCERCGEVGTRMYLDLYTIIVLAAAALVVLVIIIVAAVKNRGKSSSSSYSYSSSSSSSSGGSYSSSSDSYSGSYSGGYSSSDSYSSNYDSYSPSVDYGSGYVTSGGIDYTVHTYDAEGYSSAPYIEDAEGYKTFVDPGDIQTFNWTDL
ncbi:MAG: hypothetical protein E7558_03670 [Ruminococcaceae bacterium]|nr:hypothetical protein [Oscillospiraceae bacterium]